MARRERKVKKPTEVLKRAKKEYEIIFQNMPIIVFTLDRKGRFLEANKFAAKVSGLRLKDVKGKSFSKLGLLGKKDLIKAFMEFRKNLQGKITGKTVYEVKLKKREPIYLELIGIPLKEQGKVTKVLIVGNDITEHRKWEEKLKDSEEHLKTIFEWIQSGIVIIDSKTHRIIDVNQFATKMIGTTKERIVGHICHKYICPAERGKCPITDLGQRVDNSERVLLKADGERVPILKTVVPIILRSRKCLLETFVDISRQKKAEEEIREAEKKFRTILNDVKDIIVFVDKYGKITNVSKSVENVLSYKQDKMIGKNVFEMGILRLRDIPKLVKLFKASMKSGKVPLPLLEIELKNKNGDIVSVEASTTAIKENGKIEGFITILRDISLRKQMDKELKKIAETRKFSELAVGRELKMVELKKRVKYLESQLEEWRKKK